MDKKNIVEMKIGGYLRQKVYDISTEIPMCVNDSIHPNTATNFMRMMIRDRLDSTLSYPSGYGWKFGWGYGTTTVAATDVAVESPNNESPQVVTDQDNTIDYQLTLKYFMPTGIGNATSPTNNNIVKEVGLYAGGGNATTSYDKDKANLVAHVNLDNGSYITKTTSITVVSNWTVEFSVV